MSEVAVKNLIEHQKRSSLKLIRTFSRRVDIQLSSVEKDHLVYGHWMAFILVSSPQVRVTFKAHFMLETAKSLAARIYGITSRPLTLREGTDFFREYCNLVAGDVKIALVHNKVDAAASLPILSRGFDEIFFPHPPNSIRAAWKFISPDFKFYCSTQVEKLEEFRFEGDNSWYESKKGEIEFFD